VILWSRTKVYLNDENKKMSITFLAISDKWPKCLSKKTPSVLE